MRSRVLPVVEPRRVWCTTAGKVIHRRKSAAKLAVRRLRSEPDCIDGRLLTHYRCGDHWHIGHKRRAA